MLVERCNQDYTSSLGCNYNFVDKFEIFARTTQDNNAEK
jgi:hypothetical protein